MDVKKIEEPMGKWVLENVREGEMYSRQMPDGLYLHYGEVCRLLKLMKSQTKKMKKGKSKKSSSFIYYINN
jgi:hypothetical protein